MQILPVVSFWRSRTQARASHVRSLCLIPTVKQGIMDLVVLNTPCLPTFPVYVSIVVTPNSHTQVLTSDKGRRSRVDKVPHSLIQRWDMAVCEEHLASGSRPQANETKRPREDLDKLSPNLNRTETLWSDLKQTGYPLNRPKSPQMDEILFEKSGFGVCWGVFWLKFVRY